MSAPNFRADYDLLEEIAQAFSRASANNRRMLGALHRSLDVLMDGAWRGQAATKFYKEMTADVLPSVKLLVDALEKAAQVTRRISKIVKQAENDAAALFKVDAPHVATGANGASAVASGNGKGMGHSKLLVGDNQPPPPGCETPTVTPTTPPQSPLEALWNSLFASPTPTSANSPTASATPTITATPSNTLSAGERFGTAWAGLETGVAHAPTDIAHAQTQIAHVPTDIKYGMTIALTAHYVSQNLGTTLDPNGPITTALSTISAIDPATGKPESIVGAALLDALNNHPKFSAVEVAFEKISDDGGSAAPVDNRIILNPNYQGKALQRNDSIAALIAHELTHVLQRGLSQDDYGMSGLNLGDHDPTYTKLNDDKYWPSGNDPSRLFPLAGPGESTNYMETLANAVQASIEYDLLLAEIAHRSATPTPTPKPDESDRLDRLANAVATYLNHDANGPTYDQNNALRFLIEQHSGHEVYTANYLAELKDPRIPPGTWQEHLRDMGFSTAAIQRMEQIATIGTVKHVEPGSIDPRTGLLVTLTPTNMATATLSPTATATATDTLTPSPTVPTNTATNTATNTPVGTPAPPTLTPSATSTPVPGDTATPTATPDCNNP